MEVVKPKQPRKARKGRPKTSGAKKVVSKEPVAESDDGGK